jgi:cholesterol transport system auxiliary component
VRFAFVVVLALFVAGCFSSGTHEAQRYYVLEVPAGKTVPERAARPATLYVAPTSTAGFYDTQDIVFSRAPGTRAYYQFNGWTEPPGSSIHAALLARLERSGAFREVAVPRGGASGLVLRTHLEEIYHDAGAPPGSVRLALSAELTDGTQNGLIARRSFSRSAPAPSYDAQGAAKALGEVLGALLDELVAWVDETAPR